MTVIFRSGKPPRRSGFCTHPRHGPRGMDHSAGAEDAREPWVFTFDSGGLIVERFDNVATDAELEAAVRRLLGCRRRPRRPSSSDRPQRRSRRLRRSLATPIIAGGDSG